MDVFFRGRDVLTVLKTIGIYIKLLNITFSLVIDVLINNRSLETIKNGVFKSLLVKFHEHYNLQEKYFGPEIEMDFLDSGKLCLWSDYGVPLESHSGWDMMNWNEIELGPRRTWV